jgi:putative ABC transport system permease protein
MYGLTIGVLGAAVGVPLGLAMGGGLAWYFRDMLPAGFATVPLGMWLAIVGSCGAGLIGAAYPAWQASRVSPLRAMSSAAHPVPRSAIVLCTAIGVLLIGTQLAMLRIDDPQLRFWAYAWVGLPIVFTGYFLLSVPVTLLLSSTVAPLLGRVMRLPSDMLTKATRATPFRHGFTGGALMVGIALLVAEWSGIEALLDDWINNVRFADGFAIRTTGISSAEQEKIASLPFVTASCPIGYLPAPIIGQRVFGLDDLTPRNVIVVGFDPPTFFEMNEIDWHEGDPATATPRLAAGDGVLVADRFLTARDIGVGDSITLGAGRIQHEYEIVGVVSSAGLDIATEMFGIRNVYTEHSFSCVFMDFRTVAEHFENEDALIVQINLAEEVDDEAAAEQLEEAVPGVIFRSGRWIRETINDIAYGIVAVETAVAVCALLLACLGVGNVILANIHSRRYEYGVLRSVGAPRWMLARLVFAEATLFALVGAVIGTTLGMHLAWVATTQERDLLGLDLTAGLPELPTLLGCLGMLLMTLAAAVPGVVMLVRPQPSALLAAGRAG